MKVQALVLLMLNDLLCVDTFLWVVVAVGAWNLVNFVARVYYEEISYQYSWHIVSGIWAAVLLYTGVGG